MSEALLGPLVVICGVLGSIAVSTWQTAQAVRRLVRLEEERRERERRPLDPKWRAG